MTYILHFVQDRLWDDNGNLLSDGVNTYTYDHANRLISVVGPSVTSNYAYNGLGDRLQQTVDSVTESYTLDLNYWLTQVLTDGTNTYLYGNGRIAQYNAGGSEYFLGDALGSVRQLADAAGAVTLANTFQPFGQVMQSAGTGSSQYGFTNEWMDVSGLVYLRARYFAPQSGRFLTKDVWPGESTRPLSLNGWNYVEGNPINRRDPSGMISEMEAPKADRIVEELYKIYGVKIKKDWGRGYLAPFDMLPVSINECAPYWRNGNWRTLNELQRIRDGVEKLAGPNGLGGAEKIRSALRTQLNIVRLNLNISSFAPPGKLSSLLGDIIIANDIGNNDERFTTGIVIHEFAHVWDYRSGNKLSMGLIQTLGTWICGGSGECGWYPYAKHYDPSTNSITTIDPEVPPGTPLNCAKDGPDPNCPSYASTYGQTGPILTGPGMEDWALSFEAYVYPERLLNYFNWTALEHGGVRENYVRNQIKSIP